MIRRTVSFCIEPVNVSENTAFLLDYKDALPKTEKNRSISQILQKLDSQEDLEISYFPPNKNCMDWFKKIWPAFIVLGFITCEKFAFNGIQTLFSLYLISHQKFTNNSSKIQYHLMVAISYLATVILAGIADSGYGKLRVILSVSLMYCSGIILLLICCVLSPNVTLITTSSGLLAFGSGGIKACLSTFAIEQLKTKLENGTYVDASAKSIELVFALIHMCVNIAGLLANLTLPVMRSQVQCNVISSEPDPESADCYLLAFGVAGLVFMMGLIIFISAYKYYKPECVKGSILAKLLKHLFERTKNRIIKVENKKDIEFDSMLSRTLKLTYIFMTFPIFWALYEQQGSSWLFQAAAMDGRLVQGYNIQIKPEQMLVINVLCCVIMLPIVNLFLYPVLSKCGFLEKIETRIVFGYFLAATSFFCSGALQIFMDRGFNYNMPIDDKTSKVSIVWFREQNGLVDKDCFYNFNLESDFKHDMKKFTLSGSINSTRNDMFDIDIGDYFLRINSSEKCTIKLDNFSRIKLVERAFNVIGIFEKKVDIIRLRMEQMQTLHKTQFCLNSYKGSSNSTEMTYWNIHTGFKGRTLLEVTKCLDIEPGVYKFQILNKSSEIIVTIPLVTTSLITLMENDSLNINTIREGYSIHILYQIPQIILITFAEIFFCIAGVTFAYFEAPSEMKTLMVAVNYATIFVGNILVIFLTLILKNIREDYILYFIYTGLCLLGTISARIALTLYERKNTIMSTSDQSPIPMMNVSLTSKSCTLNKQMSVYSIGSSIRTSSKYERQLSSNIWSSKMVSGGCWDSTQYLNAFDGESRRFSFISIDRMSSINS